MYQIARIDFSAQESAAVMLIPKNWGMGRHDFDNPQRLARGNRGGRDHCGRRER
jgi:hypothetical protein